jgi:hypothetical protein
MSTGESQRARRKTCPIATLSTSNPTLTEPSENPCLRGDRPVTYRLSQWHDKLPACFKKLKYTVRLHRKEDMSDNCVIICIHCK